MGIDPKWYYEQQRKQRNRDKNSRAAPVAQHHPGYEPVGADAPQAPHPERVLIRVCSVRKRLIDSDNLIAKWHVDMLRYLGVIKNDSPEMAQIETTQRQTEEDETEFVEIRISRLEPNQKKNKT